MESAGYQFYLVHPDVSTGNPWENMSRLRKHKRMPVFSTNSDTPYRKLCRMRWSALIERVYEVDPLRCPQCGGTMSIVAFMEQKDQADVIGRLPLRAGSLAALGS